MNIEISNEEGHFLPTYMYVCYMYMLGVSATHILTTCISAIHSTHMHICTHTDQNTRVLKQFSRIIMTMRLHVVEFKLKIVGWHMYHNSSNRSPGLYFFQDISGLALERGRPLKGASVHYTLYHQ